MKFQKLEAFEKHLKESFPDHLSSIYLVVSSKDSERQKILDSLSRLFQKECELKKCTTLKETLEYLQTPSLFSAKTAAIFDGLDQLTKGEIELLIRYVTSPSPHTFLILGAEGTKNGTELYKQGKKELVWLDLTGEKPWEEADRLKKWVMQVFATEKKQIAPDALEALLDKFPPDRLLLQQEIDKLVTYATGRNQITRQDVEELCLGSPEINLFNVAKQLVWGKGEKISLQAEVSTLLPLISILRGQLEIGLKMGTYLDQGIEPSSIEVQFPTLRPKAFQECLEGARTKGRLFFKRGLLHLFELEFGVKTSLSKPENLFAIFCGKLGEVK